MPIKHRLAGIAVGLCTKLRYNPNDCKQKTSTTEQRISNMDVKKLLKCPGAFADLTDPTLPAEMQVSLEALGEAYRQTASDLKGHSRQKQAVAKQFKKPDLSETERAQLKQSMQTVSAEVKKTEQQLKHLVRSAQDLISSSQDESELPGQFNPLTATLGKSLTFGWLENDSQAWAEFLQEHRELQSHYHLPAFSQAIQSSFGYETRVFGAYQGQQLVGALPITLIQSSLFGHNAVSLPYFNYGGPISRYQDVIAALLEQSDQILADTGAEQLEVRTTRPGLAANFSDKKASMILRLPSSQERLDDQLGAKVRAQINQAVRHHPTNRIGGEELLDDFYRVFAHNMRDLGTPVYSQDWFRALLNNKKTNSRLIVCYLNAKPVSCGFLCGGEYLLEIPWASTLKSANAFNMNMWMYRQILGFAIEHGYQFFDFGRSSKDAGTYKFKKQWGAKPVQHFWYFFRRDGAPIGAANPDNPKYRLLINIWKRLPVWLTRLIGPPIVKQIP
ncbi:hypothetical protein MED297_19737 [Reinekea sp. MED297]|uniref:BioF2-like acetyltransferase domain-containing protein n=2 Tax=Reinekea TaxID=230494 RepID=A4B952_9GAMM|nr:hypothetical protein MED297_19737 [Reinekea sp. MED297] [Reinekea blandensis MED297]